MADIEIVETAVGTGASGIALTSVPSDAVIVLLYIQKDQAGSRVLDAPVGLGATWGRMDGNFAYAFSAVAIGVNPTATSGTITYATTPVDALAAQATVVAWVVRGLNLNSGPESNNNVNGVRIRKDSDSAFAGSYGVGYSTLTAAPGQAVLAAIFNEVWTRDLSFPRPAITEAITLPTDAEWQHPSGQPGIAWLDSSGFKPEGEVVKIDADWTPQPGDTSQVLSGETRYKAPMVLLTIGDADPLPPAPMAWPDPVWAHDYEPDFNITAQSPALCWLDEERTKAAISWVYEAYDENWDTAESSIRARLIDLSGPEMVLGPPVASPLPAGWEFNNYNSSIAAIGDGYFVAGSGNWLDSPSGSSFDQFEHQVHLFKISDDGTTLEALGAVSLPTPAGFPDIGYQPFFAPTANPDRVLVAALCYPDTGSTGAGVWMWTCTRSGDTLTFAHEQKVVNGAPDPYLWTDRSRTIGYVGPVEQPSNSTIEGSIFTLDADGVPTVTATGVFDHIPHGVVANRWAEGPGDRRFTSTWNYGGYAGSVFDMVTVEVTETGMEIVDRWGQYHGDAGWQATYDRWIPSEVTPDGRLVMLPSIYWDARSTQRPYVLVDPQGAEPMWSDPLPSGGAWVRWDGMEAFWGMDLLATDTHVLVAVLQESYYYDETHDDDFGSGNTTIALAYLPMGPGADPIYPPTSAIVPGPRSSEPWGAPHHGRFKIADFGERKGQISFGAKMSADAPYYVKIYARYSGWVEASQSFVPVGEDVLVYGPATIGDEGGEFGYTSQIFFHDVVAPANATHWQPVIHWFSTPPTPEGEEGTDSGLPPGGRVRMDDFFIPDNGYPVHDRPYLDGDQSFGVWEGPRAASTSVYGDAAAITLARMVTLDDEFLIPDGDDADPHLLTLDDDLLI